jgi:sigma-B regulation protein RsbU (phosphoserine phosphatase)
MELAARKNDSPSMVFNTVNEQLCLKNDEGMFATAICGVIDINTGIVTLCDAGHSTPIMALNNAVFSYHTIEKNMPLGILGNREYKETHLNLKKYDTFLFYTDGFTECVGKAGDMLGEQALLNCLKDNSKSELQLIANKLWDLVKYFRNGAAASDDTTLLILRFLGKK